jgi:hypothetical protein
MAHRAHKRDHWYMRESRESQNGSAGHEALPFLDAELIDSRRKQRQLLASIPDWIFDEGVGFPPLYPTADVPRPPQPALVEMRLRRSAQVHLDQLAGMIEHGNRFSAAAATRQFLTDWANASPPRDDAKVDVDTLLHSAIDDAEKEHLEQAAFIEQIAPDVTPEAWQAVALLAIADVLADDGYRDPRLR